MTPTELADEDVDVRGDRSTRGRRRQILIGDRLYASKGAVANTAGALLGAYATDEEVSDPIAAQFLLDLLKLHPDAEQKIGCGVASFHVRRNGGSRGFWLTRTDGTATDWSYIACLTPPSHERMAMAALRTEIRPQISAYRDDVFLGAIEISCEVTGCRITRERAHVDHNPTFAELAERWLETARLSLTDVRIAGMRDGSCAMEMADREQAASWSAFHKEHAGLRVVLDKANLGWLRNR